MLLDETVPVPPRISLPLNSTTAHSDVAAGPVSPLAPVAPVEPFLPAGPWVPHEGFLSPFLHLVLLLKMRGVPLHVFTQAYAVDACDCGATASAACWTPA
jgi:hypothetical protein